MKHVNDVNKVSNQKTCINMQEMDKKWNKDLDRGDDTQKKTMRKWNEG